MGPHLSWVMRGIERKKRCWVRAWESLESRQGGDGVLRCGGVSGSLWDSLVPGLHGGGQWVSLRSPVYREICQMHESDPLVAKRRFWITFH